MATRPLILPVLVGCLMVASTTLAAAPPIHTAALEDLSVNHVVDGDVVVLGGDVHLGPDARVRGHVVSVYGEVKLEEGAQVDGRVIAVSSLANPTLASAAGAPDRGLAMAIRLSTAGVWLLATTLAAFLFPGRIRHGIWILPSLGIKVLVLGLLVAVTLVAALVAVVGIGPAIGVPLAIAVAAVFLAVKTAGLATLGGWLGGALMARLMSGRSLPLTADVFVGVTAMMMFRFLPLVGGFAWTVLTVVALGVGVFALAMAPESRSVRYADQSGPRPSP
jgi:hypothetical protein